MHHLGLRIHDNRQTLRQYPGSLLSRLVAAKGAQLFKKLTLLLSQLFWYRQGCSSLAPPPWQAGQVKIYWMNTCSLTSRRLRVMRPVPAQASQPGASGGFPPRPH
ncbi:MAG: hypothetical protein A3E79_07000 [Burkholderiales bacterium RIFCSPHIGHO2_12_FULL_61_11]|nr:MAG: hypothetical protein A3E79_07000 [Burkholderiales bacterium RIFCSPHIGHO2_12_FULL_61_11]